MEPDINLQELFLIVERDFSEELITGLPRRRRPSVIVRALPVLMGLGALVIPCMLSSDQLSSVALDSVSWLYNGCTKGLNQIMLHMR